MGRAWRSAKSERPPSRPRFAKCIRLQSSSRRFSTGRAGQRQPERRRQRVGGARGLAVGVLDRLRLVEHHRSPGPRGQRLRVEAQQRVAGQRHVGGRDRARGSRRDRRRPSVAGRKRASSACQLKMTLVGATTSVRPARLEHAHRLQRLAEAHVVGEDAAQAGAAEKRQPAHALALVGRSVAVRSAGSGASGRRSKPVDQRRQAIEAGRRRVIELGAQRGQRRQRVPRQAAVVLARGQQIGDALAVLLQPAELAATPSRRPAAARSPAPPARRARPRRRRRPRRRVPARGRRPARRRGEGQLEAHRVGPRGHVAVGDELQPRHQLRRRLDDAGRVARQIAAPAFQLLDEAGRVGPRSWCGGRAADRARRAAVRRRAARPGDRAAARGRAGRPACRRRRARQGGEP